MPVLLIRHAKAETKNREGDWARGLTPQGRIAFRRHARKLASLVHLEGIATSPYVRAVQTAEILAEVHGINDVKVRSELVPGRRAAARIVGLALELGTGWGLVGHDPSLSEAAARALGLKTLPWSLKKGSVLALRCRGNGFTFEWLAMPGREVATQLPAEQFQRTR